VVYGRGVGVAQCVGMVACRSHGTAPTWGATPATALAALCPLAVVADDGGCQTLSSLEGNPCSSRLIREGSGVWYRFQLLSLRQRVVGIRRRSASPCKSGDGLSHQLVLFQVYHNFVLPHASLRQAFVEPIPTNGSGSAKVSQQRTPATAAGLTDHV